MIKKRLKINIFLNRWSDPLEQVKHYLIMGEYLAVAGDWGIWIFPVDLTFNDIDIDDNQVQWRDPGFADCQTLLFAYLCSVQKCGIYGNVCQWKLEILDIDWNKEGN